jgi:glutathione S-transferase
LAQPNPDPLSSHFDARPPIVHGFQRSTYVNIVRLVLTHKGAPFVFNDLEPQMGGAEHLSLHPFGRVPVLEHGDFVLYETGAIVFYLDEVFPDPPLTPGEPRARARMHQWISAVNAYYYPQIVYHLVHERLVFPPLGIAPDEKVVAAALPRIGQCMRVLEDSLSETGPFLLGEQISLADFFLYPSLFALALTDEGGEFLDACPNVTAWLERINRLPSVEAFRAGLPPSAPIEHARDWVDGHRPKY